MLFITRYTKVIAMLLVVAAMGWIALDHMGYINLTPEQETGKEVVDMQVETAEVVTYVVPQGERMTMADAYALYNATYMDAFSDELLDTVLRRTLEQNGLYGIDPYLDALPPGKAIRIAVLQEKEGGKQ